MQRLSVLVVTLIALALAGPSAISAQNAGSSLDGLGLPELRVSVTDAGIDVPSQTEAGRYLVVLDNPSPYDVEVTLFLPPDGLTASQLEATPDAEEGDPDWFYDAIIVGGVAADAGGADRAVLDLAPAGDWVVEVGRFPTETAETTTPADFRESILLPLATTGGFVSTTGIAGLTLGGGIGWLMRSFGLACDNLLSADVVTADGRLVTASADEYADLFWGLRGGGGNFGVVTSFEYRLHEVGPNLVAGPLFHPLAAAGGLLRFYRDVTATMPDALTCEAGLLTSPDGVALVGLIPTFVGPLPEGEAAVRPLREFGAPVADLVGPMPYRTLQTLFDPAFPSGRRGYWKSSFLRGLEDEAIDILADRLARVPSPHTAVLIEQFGGAVSEVGRDETAFSLRGAPYNLIILAGWDDPTQDEANIGWARELWTAMQPFAAEGVYVNYLNDVRDEGEARVRAAYGDAKYGRLAALKRTYDPTNLFRLNQNIRPA